jgi:tetratricopeptide (TPR) repeat protein
LHAYHIFPFLRASGGSCVVVLDDLIAKHDTEMSKHPSTSLLSANAKGFHIPEQRPPTATTMTTSPMEIDQTYRFDANFSSTVVDLNNQAVSYLQEGNYRSAVWDLERALRRLEDPKIWYYHEHHLQTSTSDLAALRVQSVHIAPSAHDEASRQNIFEFYRRAFQIVSSRSEQHLIPPYSNMIVLKFNEAIAYHDDAIRCGRQAHFNKALELYQDVLNIMHQYGVRGHLLLLMAIGNNVGHIHAHLVNFPQARAALYWVRQLALVSRKYADTVPRSDYIFFYKTVTIFNGNDLNAAPAA